MMHFGLKLHRRPDRPFLPRSARLGNARPCPIHQSERSVEHWSLDTALQHHKRAWPRIVHSVQARSGTCRREVDFLTCPRASAVDLSAFVLFDAVLVYRTPCATRYYQAQSRTHILHLDYGVQSGGTYGREHIPQRWGDC